MRLAVDISAASNPAGSGVTAYVRALARHLPAAAGPGDELYYVSRPGRSGGLARCGLSPAENVKIGILAFPFDLFFKNKIDVFHGPDARLPKYNRPLVATVFDLFSIVSEEFADKNFREKKTARYRDIAERADIIIVPSENTRSDVLQHLDIEPERVIKIPLAAGLQIGCASPDAIKSALGKFDINGRYVLFAGDVSARKNLARLIRAFGKVLSAGLNDVFLVIAGKEAFGSQEVRTEAAKLPAGCVKFIGYVLADELALLYAGAAVFAFPSLYEGFGMPVLEAFSAGVPVVASNRGSIPEVAGDAAILVDPENEGAISDAIAKALSNESLRSEMREKGKTQLGKFSWEKCAAETLAAYRAAIERFGERKVK